MKEDLRSLTNFFFQKLWNFWTRMLVPTRNEAVTTTVNETGSTSDTMDGFRPRDGA